MKNSSFLHKQTKTQHLNTDNGPILVTALPDLEQTNGRVKPVEYREGHGHVSDDSPGPDTEEFKMIGPHASTRLLQRVDRPHGDVDDDQEGDELLAGLLRRPRASPPGDLCSRKRKRQRENSSLAPYFFFRKLVCYLGPPARARERGAFPFAAERA